MSIASRDCEACASEVLPDDLGLGHPGDRAVQVELRVVAGARARYKQHNLGKPKTLCFSVLNRII